MDSGFLDVLHDSGDDDIVAVGQSVHVDFRGIFQELVDQNRALGIGMPANLRRLRDVFLDCFQIVGDHHGPAAEHVAWANQNRQADFRRRGDGLLRGESGATARLRDIQFRQQRAEAAAIFGQVDRFRIGANDFRAIAFQFDRQIQRRLAAKLHDHSLRLFALEHCQNVF